MQFPDLNCQLQTNTQARSCFEFLMLLLQITITHRQRGLSVITAFRKTTPEEVQNIMACAHGDQQPLMLLAQPDQTTVSTEG